MSEVFLRLIPERPEYELSHRAGELVLAKLVTFLQAHESVTLRRSREIEFVDQGGYFERILCPRCLADVTNTWGASMEVSARSRFTDRYVVLRCCGLATDLNLLRYEWPAGYAKVIVEVRNPAPADWLDSESLNELGRIAGCRLRQILARY